MIRPRFFWQTFHHERRSQSVTVCGTELNGLSLLLPPDVFGTKTTTQTRLTKPSPILLFHKQQRSGAREVFDHHRKHKRTFLRVLPW